MAPGFWSRAARAVSRQLSHHGRGTIGLRSLCPDVIAMHLWHSVGVAGRARLDCFNRRDLARGLSSHCELDVFEQQVAGIRRDYRVISFAEAVELLSSGARGYGWCAVLTFDDGFATTASTALPWLDARGLPSTLFVNAELAAGRRVKDVDLVVYGVNVLGATAVAEVCARAGITCEPEGLLSGACDVRDLMRHHEWGTAKEALLAALGTTEARFAADLRIYASWPELRALPRSVTIGNHGAAHAFLPALTPQGVREEIVGGLDAVRRELGVGEVPFAFSFGHPGDLPADAAGVARGVHTAIASGYGGVNLPGTPAARLTRVPMFSSPADSLRAEYEFTPRTLLALAGLRASSST